MPINDGGLEDAPAQILGALLFCSHERHTTMLRLVLAHQYELKRGGHAVRVAVSVVKQNVAAEERLSEHRGIL